MKAWKPLLLGIGVFAIATATLVPVVLQTRSVTPLLQRETVDRAGFLPSESAALFVGVRKFDDATLPVVRYTVDDAIDLAYMFSMDRRVRLVLPQHVILALSGEPEKDASKQRLAEMLRAGAQRRQATERDIVSLVEKQAGAAGRHGLLVLSLATHGFTREGVPYILGSNSRFTPGAPSVAQVADIAAASKAQRSLIFVDACQTRVPGTRGAAEGSPLIRRMANVRGQVVFYAAVAGGEAHENDQRQNGVFTSAVLRGLSCEAYAERGTVTVGHLRAHLEREVKEWNRAQPSRPSDIEVTMDGGTENMPLADCAQQPGSGDPMSVDPYGAAFTARGSDGRRLWDGAVSDEILGAEAKDLDANGTNEVIVGTKSELVVFDRDGKRLWQSRAGTGLIAFTVGKLFHRYPQQVVALWSEGGGSRLTVHAADDERLFAHSYADVFDTVLIDRPNRRHVPKIVLASATKVAVVDPKKSKPVWMGVLTLPETIERLQIVDHDGNERRDISVSTRKRTFFLDFRNGNTIGAPAPFRLEQRSRRKR